MSDNIILIHFTNVFFKPSTVFLFQQKSIVKLIWHYFVEDTHFKSINCFSSSKEQVCMIYGFARLTEFLNRIINENIANRI